MHLLITLLPSGIQCDWFDIKGVSGESWRSQQTRVVWTANNYRRTPSLDSTLLFKVKTLRSRIIGVDGFHVIRAIHRPISLSLMY